jgi:hypothetical protein
MLSKTTPFIPKRLSTAAALNSLEKVDVCKLAHLLHIIRLDNLFVVE